jgi:hypothetical protein
MNPIDSLIEAACSMKEGPLLESIAVTEGAMSSARALCDSFIAALGDVGQYDFFRAEFRLPSESREPRQEPEAIPQQPVSVEVNVNAIVRQIQEAIGDIQASSVNVPAVYKSYAVAGESRSPEVKAWHELTKISVPDAPFSKEYSLAMGHLPEVPREVTKETIKEVAREPHASMPPDIKNRRVPDSAWYRSHDDKSRKRLASTAKEHGPEKSSLLSQNVEQTIKRSTLVIDQLENVARNVVSTESIVKEVRQSSSAIEQLRSIRLEHPASMPTAQAPADASTAISNIPQWRQPLSRQEPMQAVERPASGIHDLKADSEANARGLSDAISRSMTVPAAGIPPMKELSVQPPAHVARAMTAIVGSYQLAGNYIGLGSAQAPIARLVMAGSGSSSRVSASMNVYRSMEAVSRVSPGVMAQSPIVSLINNASTPGVSAAPVDVLVQMSGAAAPGAPRQARQINPVVNLAVSMAAVQAAQKAGTSVIREFVRVSPSMSGGYNAQALVDRNVVNVSMPGVTVERGMSNNVSRASNYHNTFNINITMKGGSEESDMKELGKKIGRILSDEIKRYGGA